MIPARKNRWFLRWFSGVARARIERTFQFAHVRGISRLRAHIDDPLLVVSNHTAYWDTLVAVWLTNHVTQTDSYALMNAKNLRRVPFLGLVGGVGVDLDDPRDGGLAIRYAAKLLREQKRLVWIFAQGDERPITERPLNFRGGSAAIARLSPGATVLPLALRYEFSHTERPGLHVNIGEPLPYEKDIEAAMAAQEAAVLTLMEELDALIIAGTQPRADELFHQYVQPFWSRWAEHGLARLTRGAIRTDAPALRERRDFTDPES